MQHSSGGALIAVVLSVFVFSVVLSVVFSIVSAAQSSSSSSRSIKSAMFAMFAIVGGSLGVWECDRKVWTLGRPTIWFIKFLENNYL
jgi:hypothetical protein